MTLFETVLALLLFAIVLLRVARRWKLPYPTLLALTGACSAALPWAPSIALEPHLALVLFLAPVLLDSAYDLPPRELLRSSVPLTLLAVFAVVLSAAVVAWVGWAFGALPFAAALTLGAIVAPPDAAAAAAVLRRFDLPRRTLAILQGESLLNDAVALLIFNAGLSWARPGAAGSAGHWSELLLAAPGGVLLGIVLGRVYLLSRPWVAGSLSVTILELVSTFGTWIIAERLRLSPILAIVAFAMVLARRAPEEQTPRDRVQSYAVWGSLVFVLNVLAFLIMGLQARVILRGFEPGRLWHAASFALAVLGVVIVVRLAWVLSSGAFARRLLAAKLPRRRHDRLPTLREELLIGWCGMRGLISLATSFALPSNFPGRELIVLTAFTVVLGTLVIQGLTISPLLRWLEIPADHSLVDELSTARNAMSEAALHRLEKETGEAASALRAEYRSANALATSVAHPLGQTDHDRLRASALVEERRVLMDLRRRGDISDEAFHALEEQLDWWELGAAPPEHSRILEG